MNHEQAVATVRRLGGSFALNPSEASAQCHYVADLADQAQALKQQIAELQACMPQPCCQDFDRCVRTCVPMLEHKISAWREYAGKLEEALRDAKVSHYICEDPWYSCPLSEEGCANEFAGKDCDCGAESHNSKIDAALAAKPGEKTS